MIETYQVDCRLSKLQQHDCHPKIGDDGIWSAVMMIDESSNDTWDFPREQYILTCYLEKIFITEQLFLLFTKLEVEGEGKLAFQ